jgi:Flp pilus assembly protein TadD
LGRLLLRRGNLEEAATHLQAALAINPLNPLCSFCLALAYQRDGRFPQAIRQYRQTLELDAAMAPARRNLELCRQGNREGEIPPDEIKKPKTPALSR